MVNYNILIIYLLLFIDYGCLLHRNTFVERNFLFCLENILLPDLIILIGCVLLRLFKKAFFKI